jgi:hypothetical protein
MRARPLVVVALAVAIAIAATPAAAITDRRRAWAAAGYLASRQAEDGTFAGSVSPVGGTADAVVSLVAARRGPRVIGRSLGYLADQVRGGEVDTVGLRAKVVMAARAGGRNPRRFGGENIVHDIRMTLQSDGRYGETTPVFDQTLAILALTGVGVPIPESAETWLAQAQCDDGGWQYDEPAAGDDDEHCWDGTDTDFFQSDTNTTALAVQALESVGAEPPGADPFGYFDAARDPIKRGWGYDLTFNLTDANSTSLVIQAFVASDRDAPHTAERALRNLQYDVCGNNHGAFALSWQDPEGDGTYKRTGPDTYATTGAILGLLDQALPVPPHDVTKPARLC